VDNVRYVLGLKTSAELNVMKCVERINSQYVNDPLSDFENVIT